MIGTILPREQRTSLKAKSRSGKALLLPLGAAILAAAAPAFAADDLTRPIRASEDGHYLLQPDGKPFFWLGDTAWELFHRLDREETEVYLQDRARKGFNVIQAVAAGRLDYDGLKAPNRAGEIPFIEGNPARPNPRYFEHVDWVVRRAAQYGLRIALLPVWAGAAIIGTDGKTPPVTAGNAEALGRWLGSRYRGQGIIWVLGGDINPVSVKNWQLTKDERGQWLFIGDQTLVDYRPVYDAMAKGIIAGDGPDPFITFHPTANSPLGSALPLTSLFLADRSWLDMNMLQSGHTELSPGRHLGGDVIVRRQMRLFQWSTTYNYEPVRYEYDSTPARPVVDGEPRYEDHPISYDKTKGYWRAYDSRNATYHALFAGAAGHTYGNWNVWDFNDPARKRDAYYEGFVNEPWQKALHAAGAGQMQHAKALLLSRPYFSRVPDQSLIVGEQGEGAQHIGATRDRDGSYAMIYLPQGQAITVDMTKLSGKSAIGWWFDPRNGKATRIEGTLPTNQPRRFTCPTSSRDQDWVLILDDASKGFPIPGSSTLAVAGS